LEEISDLNILPESFSGSLETLWHATFGLRAAICLPLDYVNCYLKICNNGTNNC